MEQEEKIKEYKKQISELQSALATERHKLSAISKGLIPRDIVGTDQPQQSRVKTLQECKDEVATWHAFNKWSDVPYNYSFSINDSTINYEGLLDLANKRFYSQPVPANEGREWVKCPNCGINHKETDCQGYCTASCLQQYN